MLLGDAVLGVGVSDAWSALLADIVKVRVLTSHPQSAHLLSIVVESQIVFIIVWVIYVLLGGVIDNLLVLFACFYPGSYQFLGLVSRTLMSIG